MRSICRYVDNFISFDEHGSFLIFDEYRSVAFDYIVYFFRFGVEMRVESFTWFEYTECDELIFSAIFSVGCHELDRSTEDRFSRDFVQVECLYRHTISQDVPCVIAV